MNSRSFSLVNKKFSEYLVPTILTAAAISVTSVVDGVIVGNLLGSSALAAVGLSAPFIFGNNAIFTMFAVGGVTTACTARGERNEEHAGRFFTACLSAGMTIMLLYALAVTIFAEPLCTALACGDAALAENTRSYVTSLIWAGPFLMFSLGSAQFWKIEGNPKASMRISLIANGVNLVSDYVMIRFLNMGIAGAGLSTTLGYSVGAVLTIGYYRWAGRSFHFMRLGLWIFRFAKEIIVKGMYRAATSLSSLVQNLIINTMIITAFGSDGLAAMTICINARMIANIFIIGASETLQPILATLFGEKDIYGIRVVFRRALIVTVLMCAPLMVAYLAFPGVLGTLFGSTVDTGILYTAIRLYTIHIPFHAVLQLLQSLYNSTGHSKRSICISLVLGLVLTNGYALLLNLINSSLLWLFYALAGLTMLLITICCAAWTRHRRPELHGLLLLPEHKTYIQWETSVPADNEHASALSIGILDFCEKNGLSKKLAIHIAIASEEMTANTAMVNLDGKQAVIDVMVCVSEERILLRMRDNGIFFNPLVYNEDDELIHDRIDMLVKMATNVEYSHQLGFNIVTLEFMRT